MTNWREDFDNIFWIVNTTIHSANGHQSLSETASKQAVMEFIVTSLTEQRTRILEKIDELKESDRDYQTAEESEKYAHNAWNEALNEVKNSWRI